MRQPKVSSSLALCSLCAAEALHRASALRLMVMSKATEAASHAARTAVQLLRYLRRPATLRMVSSETDANFSLSFAPTRFNNSILRNVAWSGTPWG